MTGSARDIALAGAVLSLTVVILAALGGHLIDMRGLRAIWQTAQYMHMFNAAALLGLAALLYTMPSKLLQWGAWLVVSGTVIFCGSIYLHIISDYLLSGAAPAGGLLMMTGWTLVVLAFIRRS